MKIINAINELIELINLKKEAGEVDLKDYIPVLLDMKEETIEKTKHWRVPLETVMELNIASNNIIKHHQQGVLNG